MRKLASGPGLVTGRVFMVANLPSNSKLTSAAPPTVFAVRDILSHGAITSNRKRGREPIAGPGGW
jgi:hypothetical protein